MTTNSKPASVPDDRVFFEWEDEDGDRIMLEIEEGRAVLSVGRKRPYESGAAYLPTGERLRRLVAAIAEADAALTAPTPEDDDLAAKVRERSQYQPGDLLTSDEFWAAVDADDNAPTEEAPDA